jgi:DNA-binding transcriptional ArsR family regulator
MTSFADAPSRSDDELERAAALLQALAHPVRLRILEGLLSGRCCVGSMVDCLGLPQPLVSRHLAILREAGVLESEADGRQRHYRVVSAAAEQALAAVLAAQKE